MEVSDSVPRTAVAEGRQATHSRLALRSLAEAFGIFWLVPGGCGSASSRGTATSANRARSAGPALFVSGSALHQLRLFWLAPIAGAAFAGVAFRDMGPAASVDRRATVQMV